jgi:hypothetical protein
MNPICVLICIISFFCSSALKIHENNEKKHRIDYVQTMLLQQRLIKYHKFH